jgi:hypothetical protein
VGQLTDGRQQYPRFAKPGHGISIDRRIHHRALKTRTRHFLLPFRTIMS